MIVVGERKSLRDGSTSKARRRALKPRPELLEGRVVMAMGPYFLQATLSPTTPNSAATFGSGVALSRDGDLLVVGARDSTATASSSSGTVTTYERDGAWWSPSSVLAGPESSTMFANGIALSADGGTLAVAWRGDAPSYTTAVEVYERSGDGWTSTASLAVPTLGILSELALSADGSVLAVGAGDGYWEDGQPSPGFVQMFAETEDGWESTARLVAPETAQYDHFGISVALSGDGGTLIVGAIPPATDEPSRVGVAFVFEDEGSGWDLGGRIDSPAHSGFGYESAISENGLRMLVQGYDRDPESGHSNGVVYAYSRDGETWNLEAQFDGEAEDYSFGTALALNADGSTGVIGSYHTDLARGAATVIQRTGSEWAREETLTNPGLNPGQYLGTSVAIGDRTIAAGATGGWGAASVFYAPEGFQVVADPADQTGHPFAPVAFTATAAGADSIATQWQTSADGGQTWEDVPGATDPRLSFTPTLTDSGRLYRASFTDGDGATAVTRPATLTVLPATSVVTIVSEWSRFNEEAVFSIVVSAKGEDSAAAVGGTVEFAIGSFQTTVAVVDGVATVRVPAQSLLPGVYFATADYSGDEPVMGPGATSVRHDVLRGTTSIRLSVVPASPFYGHKIQVVAAIVSGESDPGDGYRPTGEVLFSRPTWAYRSVEVGEGGLVAAVLDASFLDLVGNVVTASYMGDPLYEPSATVTMTFDQMPAATTLVGVAAPTTFGEPVHFRAKVGSESTAPIAGTVVATVRDSWGNTFHYEQVVMADGLADFVFEGMRAGRLDVTLEYSDADGRFLPSQDFDTVQIARAPTSIVISSSTELAAPGSWVRFTATVVSDVTGEPVGSGEVTFVAGGLIMDTVSIYPAGEATYWTSAIVGLGPTEIVGHYLGGNDYLASDSAVFVQHIGPPPALLRPETNTTLSTSAATTTAGEVVAFTASVTSPKGGPTWGMVDFSIGGVIVASVPVELDGRATLLTKKLVSGVYTVSASFRGTEYYQSSASAALSQTVLPGAVTPTTTNTWLGSSVSPSLVGDAVILTAWVWAPDGGATPNTGMVRFYVGLQAEREVAIDALGRAVLPINSFLPGEYLVTAVYLGADGRQPSQSQHIIQVVTPRPSDSGATVVEVPKAPAAPDVPVTPAIPVDPVVPSEPAAPAEPTPSLTRRERALARLRARREAIATARAERLARLAQRRPPAVRMR